MGASLGSSEKGSRNVELNIVPFIDLMSCLTAFLLVTAVWVNISSLDNAPTGRGRQEQPPEDPNDKPRLGILIEENQLSLTLYPAGVTQQVGPYNWPGLEAALREYSRAQELPPIEVAADSTRAHPIEYRHVIAAMDTAAKVGFPRVGVVDAAQLTR